MTRKIRAAAALLCGCLVLSLFILPTLARDEGAALQVIGSPLETGEETLQLEHYRRSVDTGRFQFQDTLELTTRVNRASYGAELTFTAQAPQVAVYVECLTDLDADGRYEWPDGGAAPVWQALSDQDTLSAPRREIGDWFPRGESRTLSAESLVALALSTQRERTAQGLLQLSDLELAAGGDVLFCFTVQHRMREGDKGGTWGTYYLRLDPALEPAPDPTVLGAAAFRDVPPWSEYWAGIDHCVRRGLLSGSEAGQFSPAAFVSRAALCQALYNRTGRPGVALGSYPDVPAGQWYAPAVSWAAGVGLISGYEDGALLPLDLLNREQLAVILWRYARSAAPEESLFATAPDHGGSWQDASPWAREALAWCSAYRILPAAAPEGLAPGGAVSRGELAAALAALDQLLTPETGEATI